ncbi:hypothetical protein GM415_05045 [Pseudodesulfovibrio cashew]|uniref:Lipoprotein n=1 Tax=Pseudodesulfovibrio cashew TaxID=2678688 RepID=A0A6I6JBQ6_9BACT|nr:hypothetical protein [Pseudodesulfovibrio cashew]QGY39511.1 hypothetical protein GM415_05045 [Pseudodesulfovibrio cashew]
MRSFIKILVVMVLLSLCFGCNAMNSSSSSTTEPARQANYSEPDYYLDFDDIMIPKEIDYDADDSYKLDNAKFRAAIMRFKGRVEVMELVQYFLNNMAKDNWTLISNNKASAIHVLTFEKFNKSCVIQIDDSFATAKTTIFAVEVKDSATPAKVQ